MLIPLYLLRISVLYFLFSTAGQLEISNWLGAGSPRIAVFVYIYLCMYIYPWLVVY